MKSKFFKRSLKDVVFAVGPSVLIFSVVCLLGYKFINPAPPNHLVISTGNGEGDYQTYARLYKEILKEDGIDLEIRPSSGSVENLHRLQDPRSDVEVGFVQDGLGNPEEAPDLESLGSLYYEPIWIFYRSPKEWTRLSQLSGKKIAIGEAGSGTQILALRLLKESGIDQQSARLLDIGLTDGVTALKNGQVDAAIFLATATDPLIVALSRDRRLKLLSLDQAEAISRRNPFLHHLILPHGAMNLLANSPEHDVHLVSPTATLLIRDSVHPALTFLLLRAASQVHDDPGMFEQRNEFPVDKVDGFPINEEAKQFYKSGEPFWQKHLPFWLATLLDRFLIIVLPLTALIVPAVRLIPRIYRWRIKSRIYQRYGELKYLETQIKPQPSQAQYQEYLGKLDGIEDRVNHLKVPLEFSEDVYMLREHIQFVRAHLRRILLRAKTSAQTATDTAPTTTRN